eukprot:2757698-Prymnesium_polylepis.1
MGFLTGVTGAVLRIQAAEVVEQRVGEAGSVVCDAGEADLESGCASTDASSDFDLQLPSSALQSPTVVSVTPPALPLVTKRAASRHLALHRRSALSSPMVDLPSLILIVWIPVRDLVDRRLDSRHLLLSLPSARDQSRSKRRNRCSFLLLLGMRFMMSSRTASVWFLPFSGDHAIAMIFERLACTILPMAFTSIFLTPVCMLSIILKSFTLPGCARSIASCKWSNMSAAATKSYPAPLIMTCHPHIHKRRLSNNMLRRTGRGQWQPGAAKM